MSDDSSPARTGARAAGGARRRPSTWPTTTRSGAARCAVTTRSTSGSRSRRSSPGCRGSRSCASARTSARRSPASTSTTVAEFGDADVERLMADAGHRPQPGEDRRRDRQRRARRCGARRAARPSCIWSYAPDRPPPGAARPRRRPGGHAGVHGAGQGAEEARLPLRRPTTAYASMQACGIVDDHLDGPLREERAASRTSSRRPCARSARPRSGTRRRRPIPGGGRRGASLSRSTRSRRSRSET